MIGISLPDSVSFSLSLGASLESIWSVFVYNDVLVLLLAVTQLTVVNSELGLFYSLVGHLSLLSS